MPPSTTHAVASGATTVMALTSSGPPEMPQSTNSRQPPRNCGRASAGAASAPSVITMPEPRPLPRAMSSATTVRVGIDAVSGSAAMPRPSTTTVGTATHARPKRSITAPAG